MRARCVNSRNEEFRNYGARGISVCEKWSSDFISFLDWALANGYDDSLQIDRIDTNGNYDPDNCRWVTQIINCQNTRRTKLNSVKVKAIRIAYAAGIMTSSKMAKFFEVDPSCISNVITRKTWSNI